ncbi:hypothetical protein FHG87_005012 [Trinorchestia longiramus]|nr:hypothetical protein FHG87_005012 [Trinorchestia longiramus]
MNQPTPALILSSNPHIKLAALVIEAHIAILAKTESNRSILSKSLKRNLNIDTSFPDRDSQKIFNLFINPTPNQHPWLPLKQTLEQSPRTTTWNRKNHQPKRTTHRTKTQTTQTLSNHGKHAQRRKPQEKERKPAPLLTNTLSLTPANSKPHLSKVQHNSCQFQHTPLTSESSPNSQKPTQKSRSK